jgi:hypothetical protein
MGFEFRELLNAAHSAINGTAVGRCLHYALQSSTNPLVEFTKAATFNLLGYSTVEQRIAKVGVAHGREIAQMAESTGPQASLVALNQSGVMVDHSALSKSARKRVRDENFGRLGDCPTMHRLCWKWTGQTTAASNCWNDDNGKKQYSRCVPINSGHFISSLVSFTCRRSFCKGRSSADHFQMFRHSPRYECRRRNPCSYRCWARESTIAKLCA